MAREGREEANLLSCICAILHSQVRSCCSSPANFERRASTRMLIRDGTMARRRCGRPEVRGRPAFSP